MSTVHWRLIGCAALFSLTTLFASTVSAQGQRPATVFKARITPNWFDEGDRFWYRNDLANGQKEFVLVDAAAGERKPAFNHRRLSQALIEAGLPESVGERLPLEAFQIDTAANQITFRVADNGWTCDLQTYELRKLQPKSGEFSNPKNRLTEVPFASRQRGPETEIQFSNQTEGTVEILWLDTSGNRQSYGRLGKGESKTQHTFAGHIWLIEDAQGDVIAAFQASESDPAAVITKGEVRFNARPRRSNGWSQGGANRSPDENWLAEIREGNIFVRKTDEEQWLQVSQDGTADVPYQMLRWSPDSCCLVAWLVEPGDRQEVHRIESSPRGGGRAILHSNPYRLPGDRFPSYQPLIFRLTGDATWKKLAPDVEPVDFGRPRIHWTQDGTKFAYVKIDRGHQRYRVLEIDLATAEVRHLLDEQTDTFIWTQHTENLGISQTTWLDETQEILYASEVEGYRHLYLIDATQSITPTDGAAPQLTNGDKKLFAPGLKNAITSGQFVVRSVDRIDTEKRQIWFRASGMNADQDPYFMHHYRVNFDGSGLVALTAGNGDHDIQFSPDRRFLIDTYSRVDQAPIHELRRVEDGSLVCKLEEADISQLLESGWQTPEVFMATGRDGETEIWGNIYRPRDFDPNRKYPVVEDLYAGPHSAYVPKRFQSRDRYRALNELGFIVVKIDGMGTAHRSKAFHDVCWHNLKDAGFEDRILWMQAASKKYPEFDLDRVGVYGVSAGGQNAAAALLFHGDFYKAAVAGCGCHDNRMDKASWNEQWMGYPVGPQYSASSNIDNAHRLHGNLLLIVGEMDSNVPPESTLRFVDALIKANKENFEMLLVPGAGHGIGGGYGQRKTNQFLAKHLQADSVVTISTDQEALSDLGESLDAKLVANQSRVLDSAQAPQVTSPPESFFQLVSERDRDVARGFYRKYIDIEGLAAVASAEVVDEALLRTYDIVKHMLAGRPDVRQSMIDDGMYLIIIGKDQVYTDMPENRNAPNPDYLNERVRGTGGKPTSFGEENLIGWPIDRYDDESIAVHEFCHTFDRALSRIDPTWRERRNHAYQAAVANGLYRGAYAASNPGEYWAEIAQTYFDSQRVNNWNHGPIGTREQLQAYDPVGYELVRTAFRLSPEQDWRYTWPKVLPNVIAPPDSVDVNPYYTKFTLAREFTVLGREASKEALLKANDTIRKMFAYRHDILKALMADGVKLVVLGKNESLSDLPEFSDQANVDLLARIHHYDPSTKTLVVAEENVLGEIADPLNGSSAVIRVMSTALYRVTGVRPIDPDWDDRPQNLRQQYELGVQRIDVRFDERLTELYEAAVTAEKWKGAFGFVSKEDYWQAGVLAYFDALGQTAAPHDFPHPIATREQLSEYDPGLFDLVRETMAYEGHVDWRLP